VVFVDAEKNLLGVYGAVAGGKGSVVTIRETRKA
jgi:ribosomal protein L3